MASPTLRIDQTGLVLRSGARQRHVPWAAVAAADSVRYYLDPFPVAVNPKLTMQNGIKLALNDGSSAFISDRSDVPQAELLALIRARMGRSKP